MFAWFAENSGSVLVAVVLVLLAALAVFKLVKNKKQGRTSCGCGCSGCPMSGSCHKKQEEKK